MILQTKHEITSIHLNDQLHWLYLPNSNNLPLLPPHSVFSPPALPSLSPPLKPDLSLLSPPQPHPPFLISTPLSNALSLLLYLHDVHRSNPPHLFLSFSISSLIHFFIPLSPLWCLA